MINDKSSILSPRVIVQLNRSKGKSIILDNFVKCTAMSYNPAEIVIITS